MASATLSFLTRHGNEYNLQNTSSTNGVTLSTRQPEIRLISPTAILGYGYPAASLEAGLALHPDFIGVDAGSTDPGAYYLGEGQSFTSAESVRRDLTPLLVAAKRLGIPVIVGSSGGSGGDPHIEWMWDIVTAIARSEGLSLRVAIIHAEQDPSSVRSALRSGRIRPLGPVPQATEADIDRSTRIVAQMGAEPIQAALDLGVDLVLAGRSCDVSIFSALPLRRGFDPGITMHAAKIVECGAYCAEPAGASDCIFAIIQQDRFILRALNPARRVTAVSAAAHSLYEQNHPSLIVEPLGTVDVGAAMFTESPDGSVEISGSAFVKAAKYTLKLEGAARVGFRAVSIGGVRDPIAIKHIDASFDAARRLVENAFGEPGSDYRVIFRVYGRDGVMGPREPDPGASAHEIGVLIEVVANSQGLASEICSLARSTVLHHDYPGRMTVGGSLALPFSPHDGAWGPVYEFSLYHLMEIEDPVAPFRIEVRAA